MIKTFKIDNKDVIVKFNEDGSIFVNDMKFENKESFYLFINRLTDIAEEI